MTAALLLCVVALSVLLVAARSTLTEPRPAVVRVRSTASGRRATGR